MGEVGILLERRRVRLVEDAAEDDGRGVALKGHSPRGHLVHDGAEGEEVRAGIQLFAAGLLGRHISDGTDGGAGTGGKSGRAAGADGLREGGLGDLGEAEVDDLGAAGSSDEDVSGLDVAMDDALVMRGIEGIGDLDAEVEHSVEPEALMEDAAVEGVALKQLHGNEVATLFPAHGINSADIGVIQRGGGARLKEKTIERGGVAGEGVRKEFKRDTAMQVEVFSLIDHPHAAGTKLGKNAIVADGRPDHWRGWY